MHAGQAVRREDLMSRVWDEYWDGSTKTLDMDVSWLRSKLAAAGVTDVLTTLRGVGYRFEGRQRTGRSRCQIADQHPGPFRA